MMNRKYYRAVLIILFPLLFLTSCERAEPFLKAAETVFRQAAGSREELPEAEASPEAEDNPEAEDSPEAEITQTETSAGDEPVFPDWTFFLSKEETVSPKENEEPGPDTICLKDQVLTARRGDALLWEFHENYRVQDFFVCDIDHDGTEELLVLFWRIGKYGSDVPPGKEQTTGWSQHIGIYRFRGDTFRDAWVASDMGMQVASWQFDEKTRLHLTDTAGRETYWDWLSWGLSCFRE